GLHVSLGHRWSSQSLPRLHRHGAPLVHGRYPSAHRRHGKRRNLPATSVGDLRPPPKARASASDFRRQKGGGGGSTARTACSSRSASRECGIGAPTGAPSAGGSTTRSTSIGTVNPGTSTARLLNRVATWL